MARINSYFCSKDTGFGGLKYMIAGMDFTTSSYHLWELKNFIFGRNIIFKPIKTGI